jgi:hypothetical protein
MAEMRFLRAAAVRDNKHNADVTQTVGITGSNTMIK